MKAINIEWDVDFEEDSALLPSELELPPGMEDEEEISDYLSYITGFCHKGFSLIETPVHSSIGSETAFTKISYMYRDADNYKVQNECIINGMLTEEQQNQIISCLDEGQYFIPSMVGLSERQFDTWDDQVDHPWFELEKTGFSQTKDSPTVACSAEELVSAFMQCNEHNWQPTSSVMLDGQKPPLKQVVSAAEYQKQKLLRGQNDTIVRPDPFLR